MQLHVSQDGISHISSSACHAGLLTCEKIQGKWMKSMHNAKGANGEVDLDVPKPDNLPQNLSL